MMGGVPAALFLILPALFQQPDAPSWEVAELAAPAEGQALWPAFAATADGRPQLLWTAGLELRTSAWTEAGWRTPETVATSAEGEWFVNWADFPQLAAGVDGGRVASWLQRNGESAYAYEVRLAAAAPGSAEWAPRGVLHTDRSAGEHGFVSLQPLPAGGYFAAWLDGRTPGSMALFSGRLSAAGEPREEQRIDPRTCDCCQTDAAVLDDGAVVVVYRDRSAEEVRDIAVVRRAPDGAWSEPRLVAEDGWFIPGCPVNGPAVAAHGQEVAVAWFTLGADATPRVQLARSGDGGRSFGFPQRVDGGRPVGRVDLLALGDGSLLLSWLEAGEDGGAAWMARRFPREGSPGPPLRIAEASGERSAGFLRLAALPGGSAALAAWTDPATRRLRLARIGPAAR
jgi:hypothetical protein